MSKFELNEIAYYEQSDYTFAPCLCLITKVPETHTHYYMLPLNADYILQGKRIIPDNGFFAAPGALRKVAQPVIVAQDDPTPESEPEGVAPEDEPSKYNPEETMRLAKLREAFTLMRELTDSDYSTSDKYLNCCGVYCADCPMHLRDGGCAVGKIARTLASANGASDSSL